MPFILQNNTDNIFSYCYITSAVNALNIRTAHIHIASVLQSNHQFLNNYSEIFVLKINICTQNTCYCSRGKRQPEAWLALCCMPCIGRGHKW